jgi:hypothetical protein
VTISDLFKQITIMACGKASQTKVHYKGKEDDFVTFADNIKSAADGKTDKSILLAQFVNAFVTKDNEMKLLPSASCRYYLSP